MQLRECVISLLACFLISYSTTEQSQLRIFGIEQSKTCHGSSENRNALNASRQDWAIELVATNFQPQFMAVTPKNTIHGGKKRKKAGYYISLFLMWFS